jgi:hypothetical protein
MSRTSITRNPVQERAIQFSSSLVGTYGCGPVRARRWSGTAGPGFWPTAWYGHQASRKFAVLRPVAANGPRCHALLAKMIREEDKRARINQKKDHSYLFSDFELVCEDS